MKAVVISWLAVAAIFAPVLCHKSNIVIISGNNKKQDKDDEPAENANGNGSKTG